MRARGTQPTSSSGNRHRLQAPQGRWWVVVGVVLLLAATVVLLELWEHPPDWLGGTRQAVVGGLHWVRVHWLTSGAAGVAVALLGLLLQRRNDRQLGERSAPRPRQLPPDMREFTGRRAELDELRQKVTSGVGSALMVLAIDGKPGIGKTALIVHLAHELTYHFPDGQLYVNLRGAEQQSLAPALVLDRFLRSLGVAGKNISPDVEEAAGQYRTQLADKRVLVILDNAASETQLGPLLPGSPGCAVLITSRSRLASLQGAVPMPLDVFTEDEALALLSQLAGADRVAAEPEAAREIVHLCGLLPLALRIVGSQLSAHPRRRLAQLRDRLADERTRLERLHAGELDVRASFGLSYEDLSEDQQRLFRFLGLPHAADVTPWVTAALLDVPVIDAEHLLDCLVNANLLIEIGEDGCGVIRYRLHDLLRVFARDRLEAAETGTIRRAALERVLIVYHDYVDHAYVQLTAGYPARTPSKVALDDQYERARNTAQRDPVRWFTQERENLLVLIAQAYEMELFRLTSQLASSLFYFFEVGAFWADWRQIDELALDAARQSRDPMAEARALRNLGKLALNLTFEQQEWRLDAPKEENPSPTVKSIGMDGFDEAISLLTESRRLYQQLDGRNREMEGVVLRDLADAYRGTRRLKEAMASYREAMKIFQSRKGVVGSMLVSLGMTYQLQRIYDDAESCFKDGLRIGQVEAHPRLQAFALRRLGDLYRHQSRLENAVESYDRCLPIFHKLGDRTWEARTLAERGRTLARMGDHAAALTTLKRAVMMFHELGSSEADVVEAWISQLTSGHDQG